MLPKSRSASVTGRVNEVGDELEQEDAAGSSALGQARRARWTSSSRRSRACGCRPSGRSTNTTSASAAGKPMRLIVGNWINGTMLKTLFTQDQHEQREQQRHELQEVAGCR